jgi:hypothetical protein
MKATDRKDLKTYEVILWDVYNTLEDTTKHCTFHTKSGTICNKICKYKIELNPVIYCCKTHFPKDIPIKKNNNYKEKKIKNYSLQEIAVSVIIKLNEIIAINKEIFSQITDILIELQPTLNPSMKLISHIIYGKLIEFYIGTNCNIKFVRASQKLKINYDGPELVCKLKGKYAQRKWMSIQIVKYILENKFSEEQSNKWLPLLNSKKDQADMTDTLCMGVNALCGIPKKETIKKQKSNK